VSKQLILLSALGAAGAITLRGVTTLALGNLQSPTPQPNHHHIRSTPSDGAGAAHTASRRLCRNFFDGTGDLCADEPGPEPPPADDTAAESTCPHVRLAGVLFDTRRPERSLVVTDVGVHRVGDVVGERTLETVGPRSAILAGVDRCALSMDAPTTGGPPPIPGHDREHEPRATPRDGIAAPPPRIVGDEVHVDRAWLAEVEANPMGILGHTRIVPSAGGFRLYGIRRGDAMSAIGLRNGDAVREIGGVRITGADDLLTVYQRFRESPSGLSAVVERDGQVVRRTLHVR